MIRSVENVFSRFNGAVASIDHFFSVLHYGFSPIILLFKMEISAFVQRQDIIHFNGDRAPAVKQRTSTFMIEKMLRGIHAHMSYQ